MDAILVDALAKSYKDVRTRSRSDRAGPRDTRETQRDRVRLLLCSGIVPTLQALLILLTGLVLGATNGGVPGGS